MWWNSRRGVWFPHPSVTTLVTTPPGAPGGRPKTLIPEAVSRLNTCSVQHEATQDQGLARGVVLSVTSGTEPTKPNGAEQKATGNFGAPSPALSLC